MRTVVTVLIILIAILSFTLQIDVHAMQILDENFNRAMVAFGLAKALNAVISLLQGTQLSITPVGVGLNFSVGEVLDPFNDIVERFSWVMLFSSISLGITKILLTLSAKLFVQVALALSGLGALLFLWIKKSLFVAYSLKVFMFLVLLRFSAIVFVYSSELLYTSLLAKEYHHATKVISITQEKLEDIKNSNSAIVQSKKESGFFENMNDQYKSVVASLNISKQLDSLQKSINEATQNIITMITIFVFQTVVLPLLFLWVLVQLLKWIVRIYN